MENEPLVYLNGKYVPKSEAKVSVYDHGLLYGDGVFEGIRAYEGIVFQLKEHIDRLFESAGYIELAIPLGKKQITDALLETLRKNRLKNAYIRLVVTRGVGDLGVNPKLCKDSTVVIIAEPVKIAAIPTEPRVVSTMISAVRRDSVDATSHEVKTLNYMNSILAMIEANHAGVDYPVMLDSRGFVSEGPTMNIFIVKKGVIMTPATSAAILHGITRARVLRVCKDFGYETIEKDITSFELVTADEAFFTGTLAELVAIGTVNRKQIGGGAPGQVTKRVYKEFVKVTRSPEEGTPVYEAERVKTRTKH
ncbi:MAG: branched-chain-amino-acid transaminase [Thaumarchaeota archaeon]|nr:branched-chain-amino-acid transaminase [Nitrososphaerota archaeon]